MWLGFLAIVEPVRLGPSQYVHIADYYTDRVCMVTLLINRRTMTYSLLGQSLQIEKENRGVQYQVSGGEGG